MQDFLEMVAKNSTNYRNRKVLIRKNWNGKNYSLLAVF